MLAPTITSRVRATPVSAKSSRAARKVVIRPQKLQGRLQRHLTTAAAAPAFTSAETSPVVSEGQPADLPGKSGVYAVYDAEKKLQYVGISRNIHLSVDAHYKNLGETVHSVKFGVIDNATKDDLTGAWKEWLQAGVDEQGNIPPGNAGPEKEKWQGKAKPKGKPEIKLTAGKGADDLTCNIKDLVDMVVKNERIVAFIKGSRTQPQVRRNLHCAARGRRCTSCVRSHTRHRLVEIMCCRSSKCVARVVVRGLRRGVVQRNQLRASALQSHARKSARTCLTGSRLRAGAASLTVCWRH